MYRRTHCGFQANLAAVIQRAWLVFLEGFPAFKYDVRQVFADGDYVIVHSYLTGVPKTGDMVSSPVPGTVPEPKLADEVVDIYMIQDGKIVLHWDVVEPVTHSAAELFDPPSSRQASD